MIGSEWTMMVFCALTCLAAGLSAVLAAGEWRNFPFAPLVAAAEGAACALALGFAAVLFGLGRPSLFFGMLGNSGSAFFPAAVLTALSFGALVLYIAAQKRGAEAAATRGFAAAAGIFSILLVLAAGKTLVMPWREALNSLAIPAAFLAWALSCCIYAAKALRDAAGRPMPLAEASVWAALLPALGLAAYAAHLLSSDALREEGTAYLPFTGELAPAFWLGAAVLGIAVPFFLAARSRGSLRRDLLALLFTAIGTAAFHDVVFQVGMPSWHFFTAS